MLAAQQRNPCLIINERKAINPKPNPKKMPLLSKCFPCFKFKREEVIDKLDYSNTPLTDFPEVWQHERTLEELYLSTTRVSTLR